MVKNRRRNETKSIYQRKQRLQELNIMNLGEIKDREGNVNDAIEKLTRQIRNNRIEFKTAEEVFMGINNCPVTLPRNISTDEHFSLCL